MKKFLSILLTLCMMLPVLAAMPLGANAAEASGEALGSAGDVLYVLGDSISEGFLQNGKYCKSWVRNVIETNGYDVDSSLGYYDTTRPDDSQPTRLGESGLGFVTRGAWSKYVSHYLTKSFDGTPINYGNADKVVVALGINDWKATNVTLTAFFSSMENVFTTIRQQSPNCELFYLLPFNAGFVGTYNTHYALNQALDSDKTKTNGYTLRQFGDLILSKLQEEPFKSLNIQPIDMMTCDAINRDTIRDGALYRPTTHADDLHPIAPTHVELAKELSKRLEAHGHLLTKHPANDPTCSVGNTEYWECTDDGCGKFFSDEHAEHEIAENSWVIPPVKAHTFTGETSWTWTGNDTDGYTAATVNALCSECGSGEAFPAAVTRSHADGQTVYTATATLPGDRTLTDTKTVDGKILYVLGDTIAAGTSAGGINSSWSKHVIDINGYLPFGTTGSKNLSEFGLGFNYPSQNGKTAQTIANATDFSDADIVAVAIGIYDWRDTKTSRTHLVNNFYPAMYNLFSTIRSKNANCKIYFVLPFNDGRAGNYNSNYAINTNLHPDYRGYCCGTTLQEFVNLIKAKFEESSFKALDVTLIDMLECEAINRDTIRDGALIDNLLPSAATHTKLGQELAKRFSANGHLLTEHPAAGATCISSGSTAYWSCEDEGCGKYFSDPNAEHEIAENSWIIPAQGQHSTLTNPVWTWTGSDLEGYTAAKVSATCPICGTTETLTATVTKTHTDGRSVFTATATASNGQVFTDAKTVEGKTLYVLGDSIAAGYDENSSETIGMTNSWVQQVIDRNGYLPYGNNGSKNLSKVAIGFCKKKPGDNIAAQSIANETDFSGADTVIVALGINDWKETETNQATMGKLYPAMYNVFNKIRQDNPSCEVYFILPFNVNVSPGGNYDTHYSLNKAILAEPYMDYCSGSTLREFADLIKAKFEEDDFKALNVQLIDMLECAAINRDTIRDGALYDDLHPTLAAHTQLGAEIAQRLTANGHLLTAHPATAASCVPGNTAYWSCSDKDCGKFFSDEHAENEIAENSWVLPAIDAHSFAADGEWTWTGSDEEGYTAAGITVTCSACGEQEHLTAVITKSYTPESTVYTAKAMSSTGLIFTDVKTVPGQVFFTGHSISLLGDIGLNFYVNVSEEQAANAEVRFTWTVNDKEKTSTVSLDGAKKSDYGYKTTCSVAPAEMTYEITAALIVDGEEVSTNTCSVSQYANQVLSDEKFRNSYIAQEGQTKYDNLVALTHAMLDYGSRAQIRFDRNQDNLANGGIYTYTDPVSPAAIPQTMSDMSKDLADYGLEYRGSTVVLLTNTSIRHYYKIVNPAAFEQISESIAFNGGLVSAQSYGDEIFFELPDISAPDLDMVYKFHIGSSDYAYSVFDYVRSCLSKTGENASEKTQALVSAMYYYNRKAKEFFGKPVVEPEHYEYTQTPELVRNYLAAAKESYSPADYTNSVITDYAPAERSLENERPLGFTFSVKHDGTLTIDGYSRSVAAGNYTAFNLVPNRPSAFTVTDDTGRILQWGTITPTHFLRQIRSINSRNVRDLGGWSCDGGTIKYGKIIRGGAVTSEDREVFVNQLGIRTEIELRGRNDNNWDPVTYPVPSSSELGDDVDFHIYDRYAWFGFTDQELCKQILSDIFDAVQNNKSVYIHCHAGADRTGTIAFILEAILGMSQSDMDTDFELTTYYVGSNSARCRNSYDSRWPWRSLIDQINSYSGTTFRDKAVNCVLGLGFTIDDINAFRAKMIDGTPEILSGE